MQLSSIDISKVKDLPTAIEIIKLLLERVEQLEKKVAELSKTSSTSSKPPSSDIVKPKSEQRQRGKRKAGGQRGHKGFQRELLPAEQVEEHHEVELRQCPDCGEELEGKREEEVLVQQMAELAECPVVVREYRRYGHLCKGCNCIHYPALPEDVIEGQLFGARLQALIAYMKGNLGASYTELEQYCGDVLGIEVCRGMLCKTVERVSEALRKPYEELHHALAGEKSLNVDETGWRDCGKGFWVWLFCNQLIAFFTLNASRGSKVLREVLGNTFSGALISDFYSAYVCYANPLQQFCLAHLIRDIKFLTTLPDTATQHFGKTVLKHFKLLFRLWHRREEFEPDYFLRRVGRLQRKLYTFVHSGNVPKGKAFTMKKRLVKHWDNLFRFVENPELYQPTNNLAEQTLRHLIRIRRQTQGSRSAWGCTWTARIMTVLETCRKQKQSAWHFIHQAVRAYHFGEKYPTLLPT